MTTREQVKATIASLHDTLSSQVRLGTVGKKMICSCGEHDRAMHFFSVRNQLWILAEASGSRIRSLVTEAADLAHSKAGDHLDQCHCHRNEQNWFEKDD